MQIIKTHQNYQTITKEHYSKLQRKAEDITIKAHSKYYNSTFNNTLTIYAYIQ